MYVVNVTEFDVINSFHLHGMFFDVLRTGTSLTPHEHTDTVISLGPTVAGKKHDKKAADEGEIAYPTNTTLDKDTGFQGYEPAGVLTRQPKKNPKAGMERGGQVPQSSHL